MSKITKVEVNGQEFHDYESEDGPSLKVTVQDGDLTRVFEFNETGVTETNYVDGVINSTYMTRPYGELMHGPACDCCDDDDFWDDGDYDDEWDDDDYQIDHGDDSAILRWGDDPECDCPGCSIRRSGTVSVDPINPNNDDEMSF